MISKACKKNVFCVILIFIVSCNNEEGSSQHDGVPKIDYYSTGKIKSKKTVNKQGQKVGLAEEYYEGGQLKKKYAYRNDTLNGEFEAYFENGGVESKGFFWNGKPVGPTIYYGRNGKIRLYNELDFNGDIYYVQKYDDSQKVIKEEGVAVSPNILIDKTKKDSLLKGSPASINFFYSEPEGDKNSILCYVDNERVQCDYIGHHIALIQKLFSQYGIHELKVVSILNSEAGMQIAKDSVVKRLTIY